MIRELDLEEISIGKYNALSRLQGLQRIKSDRTGDGVIRFFETTTQVFYDNVGALVEDIGNDGSRGIDEIAYDKTSKKQARQRGGLRSGSSYDIDDRYIQEIIAYQDSSNHLTVWMHRTDIPRRGDNDIGTEVATFRKIDEKWYRVGLSIPGQNFSLYTFNGIETRPNQYKNPQINIVYVPPQGPR